MACLNGPIDAFAPQQLRNGLGQSVVEGASRRACACDASQKRSGDSCGVMVPVKQASRPASKCSELLSGAQHAGVLLLFVEEATAWRSFFAALSSTWCTVSASAVTTMGCPPDETHHAPLVVLIRLCVHVRDVHFNTGDMIAVGQQRLRITSSTWCSRPALCGMLRSVWSWICIKFPLSLTASLSGTTVIVQRLAARKVHRRSMV